MNIIDYRPSLYHHDDVAIPISNSHSSVVLFAVQGTLLPISSLSFIFCSRVGLAVQLGR